MDRRRHHIRKVCIITYVKKERSILLSEAVFNNYVNELIANGKIIKRTRP